MAKYFFWGGELPPNCPPPVPTAMRLALAVRSHGEPFSQPQILPTCTSIKGQWPLTLQNQSTDIRNRDSRLVWTVNSGPFTKNLKITIHTWDIPILLEKHHQWHLCQQTIVTTTSKPLLEASYVRKHSLS